MGHTLVVGPTGAGKSVLLALMALQFRRYARSQIFAFDFGGSIRAAALAMGGDWHDLGGELTDAQDALDRRMFAMPYFGTRIGEEDYPRLDPGDPDERRCRSAIRR